MSDSVQRINKYIDFKGLTKKEVELKIGMSNGLLSSQIKNKKSIGSDKLENLLLNYTDVSSEWLLRGKGPMLKSEENSEKNSEEEVLMLYRKITKLQEEIEVLQLEIDQNKRKGTV